MGRVSLWMSEEGTGTPNKPTHAYYELHTNETRPLVDECWIDPWLVITITIIDTAIYTHEPFITPFLYWTGRGPSTPTPPLLVFLWTFYF